MDDTKLEKLHKDLKQSAQSRGGRGGLGKGLDGTKRLRIDADGGAVASSSSTKESAAASASDPKHIYIKFVRASEGAAKPNEPATEQGRNQKLVSFESDDEDTTSNIKKRGKDSGLQETPTAACAFVEVTEKSDIGDYVQPGNKVINGIGRLAKATIVSRDGTKCKVKNVVVRRIYGELNSLVAEVSDESSLTTIGTLKKYKIGAGGLHLLTSSE